MPRQKKYVPKEKAVYTPSEVRNIVHNEMKHFLDDIEFRLAQTMEMSRRNPEQPYAVGNIYAEDMNTLQHAITGYTVTSNTPAAGRIAWTNLHIVYGGIDYAFTDGSATDTLQYYFTFVKANAPAPSGGVSTGNTLVQSPIASKPNLATGDCIVFLNSGGVAISVLEQNLPRVVSDNAIDTGALQSNAVTGAKVAATTITGANLVNNTITATQVASNTLTGGNLVNNTLTSTQLALGAVTATRLNVLDHVIL